MAVRKRKVKTEGAGKIKCTDDRLREAIIKMANINKIKNDANREHEKLKEEVQDMMTSLKKKEFKVEAIVGDTLSNIGITIAPKQIASISMPKLKELSTEEQYDSMVTTTMKAIEENVGTNIKSQVVSYSFGDPTMKVKVTKSKNTNEG